MKGVSVRKQKTERKKVVRSQELRNIDVKKLLSIYHIVDL